MERGAVYLCQLPASSSLCRQLIVTNAGKVNFFIFIQFCILFVMGYYHKGYSVIQNTHARTRARAHTHTHT